MNGCMPLIAIAWDCSAYALTLMIFAGLYAGLLAMVVLPINVLFRRCLSARQMGLLWGVVLLRLLIPVGPSSSLSLQNLWPSTQAAMTEPIHDATAPGDVMGSRPLDALAGYANSQSSFVIEATPPWIDSQMVVDLFLTMLPVIWLIGGATCLTWTTIVHWHFCRRLKQVAVCEDQRLCALWHECCVRAEVRWSIPIVLFDGVHQPAVLGLFRPRLLLPLNVTELTDEQLRMVMLHELAHVRHFDIAANWALVVIRAIHWWNPVYWLAGARFQSLREQSCDAFAIQRIEGQPTRGYSELLLMLAERQPSGPPWRVMLPVSLLGFFSTFFQKRAVRNRLKALRSAGTIHSNWHTAVVTVVVALVAVCGLTDASMPVAPVDHSFDWLPHVGHDWNNWDAPLPIDRGPMETRTYNVGNVLTRIFADKGTKDDARAELNALLVHIVRCSMGQLHAETNEWAQETLRLDDDVLTMTVPLNVHAEIARNLAAWEQSGLGQISVETRFLTDERDIATAIGVSWQYLEAFSADREGDLPTEPNSGMPVVRAKASVDDYLPVAVATLNEQQRLALLEAAQGDRRANVLQAPKVTIFNGTQFFIQDRTQTPFVVGIQDVSEGVQQPKIKVIDEGIKVAMRAIQRNDTAKVRLEGRIELSEIGEVRTASTLLRGKPAMIQIPRIKRCRIDVASELDDGQSLLIGCIPTYEKKRFFYVLLTVRNLETN